MSTPVRPPCPATADVVVVGAGAGGLAAAIFAAEAAPQRRVVALEGAARIGAKILVSGGGRCNVTHDVVTADDFNGVRPVVRNVLAAFGVAATVEWLASLGVELKREETGKLFPVSNRAATVVQALVARCRALGVTLATGHRVADVAPGAHGGLRVRHTDGVVDARRVVMATGGRSLPKSGSDGGGFEIVARLGHTVTPTHQALVPLVFAPESPFGALAGVSHPAELATFAGGTLVDRRAGSLLWTHVGVSGPVVMDASRHWVIAAAAHAAPELRMSLFPGEDFAAVDRRLTTLARARPKLSLTRMLAERVPERAAATLVRVAAAVEPATPIARLTREERRRVVHALTALPLPVERPRGWNYAEVTAGGVPLAEVDHRTMASRVVPGLHLVGEMLDCDGRIGGFNFQWAWATGHLAGRALAQGD
ncbi:MAG: aminoacetone oxidase family FAD-binding enzyme [Deltaproteobacteria bacterium]|nr:aminoacetone oxidase family FAD-binding enzyme [Deltaproteobacteria bacterium]